MSGRFHTFPLAIRTTHDTIARVPPNQALWPSKRPDGSLSVGPRWTGPPDALDQIPTLVAKAVAERERAGLKFNTDFAGPPEVQRRGDTVIVALHAKAGSEHWKDWLVHIVRDVEHAAPGLVRRDFYDFVAGKGRPRA